MSAHLDVRRFPYMPLYMERLRRSKAWLRCKRRPELAFYLVNLWMHAFHCVPAGSIENDDDVLADAAMCDPHAWDGIREDLLRGWEERDGRLYHPVVTEVAEEAWGKVKANQKRTEAAREARGQMKLELPNDPEISVTESVTDEEGKRREGNRTENPPAAHSTTPAAPGRGGAGASLEMRLREAAGLVDATASALRRTGPIESLMAEGLSLESTILPALRSAAAEGCKDARSWAYFVDPIRRWRGPAPSASPVSQVSIWVAKDSPEGEAWGAHERAGGRVVVWIQARAGIGRAMPSRWPPGHPSATSAAA